MRGKKNRYSLLLVGALLTINMFGCGSSNGTVNGVGSDIVLNSSKEAPMLLKKVKANEIPSLEKRLPAADDVMVENDIETIGTYGGSMNMTINDSARWSIEKLIEQPLFRFKQDGSGQVEANVAKDFYANEDSTEWTIELREGMKWSDGVDFTADDILFYYNHMSTPALNEDRTAVGVDKEGYYSAFTSKIYNCYQVTVNEKKYWAEMEKVDDYKVVVKFAAPKPSFPVEVTVDNKWMYLPKHFYKDFVARKDGVSDDSEFPLLTEEQALANANKAFGKSWEGYSTMGKDIGYYHWDYHIVPQLTSFISVKDNWNKVGETYELVRNPYFFKTDNEGHQLPYLDSIKIQIINEADQQELKGVAGEFDYFPLNYGNYSTIATSTKDTHSIMRWVTPTWSSYGISLNQTVKDQDKRKLFQNSDFRQALSICVDRKLLNSTLAKDQGTISQASVPEGMNGYDEEWAKKWTEYDVNKANELLDSITEPWDKTAGTYRKLKGTDKDVEVVVTIKEIKNDSEFVALLETAYKQIGIKLSTKVNPEVATEILANEHEATLDILESSTPSLRPDMLVPMRNYAAWYGAYGKWYEDGKADANGGIAPTGGVLKLIEAYEAMKNASYENNEELVEKQVQTIYDLHKENTWVIGYLNLPSVNMLISNKLKNVPSEIIYVDEFRGDNIGRPEQYYIKK